MIAVRSSSDSARFSNRCCFFTFTKLHANEVIIMPLNYTNRADISPTFRNLCTLILFVIADNFLMLLGKIIIITTAMSLLLSNYSTIRSDIPAKVIVSSNLKKYNLQGDPVILCTYENADLIFSDSPSLTLKGICIDFGELEKFFGWLSETFSISLLYLYSFKETAFF